MSAKEKFQAINRDFNDLPRRLLYGFALFAALALFFVLFKYVAPFAIGFAVSLMIEPVVRRITPAFRRIHLGRTGAALVCVLAGMLMANLTRFVSPSYMAWTVSGELIVMLVLVAQCAGCGGADDDEPPAAPPSARPMPVNPMQAR